MELAMDTPVSIRTCCAKYTWMSIDNPWLSIDNLRSDFEHSEVCNVHASRDVLVRKKRPTKWVFFFWFPLRTRRFVREWVNPTFPDLK